MENEKTQPTKIGKTWFIERGDGKIFACDEQEAWNTLRNRSNWQRQDFKIVGVSDGTKYVESLKSATKEKEIIDSKISEKSAEMTRYLNTLDKFKFDQLLEDTDEKVVKVKGIISGLQKEIDELNKKFAEGYQSIVNKAFDEELAIARGHIEFPQNQDVKTPGGSRDIILRNMPR